MLLRLLLFTLGVCNGYRIPPYLSAKPGSSKGLTVGLNKYSHDVSICILDKNGSCLFAGEKERITRHKHDGGDAGEVVEHALECCGASLDDVEVVVSNNHHFRVLPFEKRLPWSVGMNHYPQSYIDDANLIPGAKHYELSHHLAHAWGAAASCPYEDDCLVVVMDGMGEAYSSMYNGQSDPNYFSEFRPSPLHKDISTSGLPPHTGYREAESAYMFTRGLDTSGAPLGGMTSVHKRYTEERSPPELYNHGFHDMESVGAVYSRISSHIFGDWNACGKVMGLAPWAGEWKYDKHIPRLMEGDLLAEKGEKGAFKVNWGVIESLPHVNQLKDKTLRPFYAALAKRVQDDLEDVALTYVKKLREKTGARTLCFCGGVALNSVLNGRISRECGFDNVYITHHPGDEGISIGCAAFGHHYRNELTKNTKDERDLPAPVHTFPLKNLTPYSGKSWSSEEIEDSIFEYVPWIQITKLDNIQHACEYAAKTIAQGKVIGWFQGRSEFGPRALGNRSFLADPRDKNAINHINSNVKLREDFRPFAPSVLNEQVSDWFESCGAAKGSPYMSLTTQIKQDKQHMVPAVCHVDGSSRLQTVTKEQNSLYYNLITEFYKITGVPMVLNTSFNVKGEPIIDSPGDAIRSFLSTRGAVDCLIIHDTVIRQKSFPLDIKQKAGAQVDVEIGDIMNTIMPEAAVQNYLSEVTARESGDAIRVRLMLGDEKWIDLDNEFQLAVLEVCDGNTSVQELIEIFEEEGDIHTSQAVIDALRKLYFDRLISM